MAVPSAMVGSGSASGAPRKARAIGAQCAGCAALRAPAPAYVAADRATYDAVAPEYAAYVGQDPALDEEERGRRARTLATWDARLRAAEEETR